MTPAKVTAESLTVLRRPGRPRGEPKSTLSTWVPTAAHDRIIQLANRRGASVSETVWKLLRKQLRREK